MTTSPRPYLRADVRRRQLLDAAARLFVRDGYAGLTMVALAAEAGVSRRLVYDHFPDLGALYDAFFDDLASRYVASIDQALADAGGDLLTSFSGAFTRLLAMPAQDQRAIRLVVAHPGLPELEALHERFRAHVEARWLRFLGPDAGGGEVARALLWTFVAAFLALADLVTRGEIGEEIATKLATAFVVEAPRAVADVLMPAVTT